jgi:hypothetical protein
LSIPDDFERRGLGLALVALQSRAISLGYLDLFGEALKSNDRMRNCARKAGFEITRSLDWRGAIRQEAPGIGCCCSQSLAGADAGPLLILDGCDRSTARGDVCESSHTLIRWEDATHFAIR